MEIHCNHKLYIQFTFSKTPGQLLNLFKAQDTSLGNDIFRAIQSHLEEGNKIEALKLSIDSKLWAVAIILASHVSKEVYSQTINNFTHQNFLNANPVSMSTLQYRNNPALCALFSLLGGSKEPLCKLSL